MRYVVGQETTVWELAEFDSDGRWTTNSNYQWNAQTATVQFFTLTANGPAPITNAFDPVYGIANPTGIQAGQGRFGGDLRFLSNGNILTCPEDQEKGLYPVNGAEATIFNGETGATILGPFNANFGEETVDTGMWANLVAFDGGWTARLNGNFNVYDNDGTFRYKLDQYTFTSIADKGRGDGVRIAGDIAHTTVYLSGKNNEDLMIHSRFDAGASSEGNAVGGVQVAVNSDAYWDTGIFDRTENACDANNNSIIAYEDTFYTGDKQVTARVYNADMQPVTPPFYAFVNHDSDTVSEGFLQHEPNVSMDLQRIVVAADGVTLAPDGGLSPAEQTIVIVLANPLAPQAVDEWSLY